MAYRLAIERDLAGSVRECAGEQLRRAIGQLEHGIAEDPAVAVHEARKSIKRSRALLRLVRAALGEDAFRRENRALRDAARLLSELRDADALSELAAVLERAGDGAGPAADLALLRISLLGRSPPVNRRAAVAEPAAMLRAVARRLDGWPLDGCDAAVVTAGIARAYRDGRSALAAVGAEPTIERLHEWRKRVKDLWYQQQLLSGAWPALLEAGAEQTHGLSRLLGTDHDLALLAAIAASSDGHDLGAAIAAIARRREQTQARARALGARVYAERPRAFARRIGGYLDAAVAEGAVRAAP